MTNNVSRFMEASQSDADLAQKVEAIGAEAAALVAARLSELSQATAFPFAPGDILSARTVPDDNLEMVSGGLFGLDIDRYTTKHEFKIGPFSFTLYDNPYYYLD